ncbi:MAG: tripartite tricarboxylate transporter substrate binding protein [Pseudomonadota bacterium]
MEHWPPGGARRRTALAALAATAATWPVLAAHAQAGPYPTKSIRVVVPFAAGGTIDTVARDVIKQLADSLGQAIYLDARPGANGVLGTDIAAHATPDGYTLLLVTGSLVVNPAIYKKLPYDPVRDLTPITAIAKAQGHLLVVNPALPVSNVQELIALSLKPGSELNYSSPGVGNTLHLSGELFKHNTGARITHVPYKGSPQALNAVIANEVQMEFTPPALAMPFIKAGKLKVLAYTGPERLPEMPGIPIMAEAGVANMVVEGSWVGLFCPTGTPAEVQARIYSALDEIIKRPAVRDSIAANGSGYLADGRPPAAFARQVQADMARYAEAVRLAGIQPE